MAELSDSKVLRKYASLGFIVAGSYTKRGHGVLLEHAYAQFPSSSSPFLVVLPTLAQMEHFSRFMRTVLALAASSTTSEFRLNLEAGLPLVIPPDALIDDPSNFSTLGDGMRFVLPVIEVWTKMFSGGIHRQSDTAQVSITKKDHENLAKQYERTTHEAELFVGTRVDDPPFTCDFFDTLCGRIVELNRRYDQMVASAAAARADASKANPSKSDAMGWQELQRHRGAVTIPAASNATGHRASTAMFMPPLYAANTAGTVFSSSCHRFNLGRLGTMLDYMDETPGVTTPYLYVSMKGTSAPWHDGRLFSAFYLHAGSSHKFWYCVPASHSQQFEELLDELCPFFRDRCRRFLDHKEVLILPELLRQRGIPVNVLVQLESTYVFTLANVYHMVLNSGYGIGTAINFALESWFPIGEWVRQQRMYCQDDVCAKLRGLNPDDSSKDDVFYVDSEGFDGTRFVVRMSRRRAVVHVETHWFTEYMRIMRLHGDGAGFYMDGFQPSGLYWLGNNAAASAVVEAMEVDSSPPAASSSSSSRSSVASADVVAAFAVVGRFLTEGSWRLASTSSSDALILYGHAQKAAAGVVDVAALTEALRSASLAGGPSVSAAAPAPLVRSSVVLDADLPLSSRQASSVQDPSALSSRSSSPDVVMDYAESPLDGHSSSEPAPVASIVGASASSGVASRTVVASQGKRGGKVTSAPSRAAVACEYCGKIFNGDWLLKRHLTSCRPSNPVQCSRCGILLKNEAVLVSHNVKSACGKAARAARLAASASGSSSPLPSTSSAFP